MGKELTANFCGWHYCGGAQRRRILIIVSFTNLESGYCSRCGFLSVRAEAELLLFCELVLEAYAEKVEREPETDPQGHAHMVSFLFVVMMFWTGLFIKQKIYLHRHGR